MDFSFARKIAVKLGMDKAIAYSSGSRIVSGVAGVLSVFFITSFLTGVEQGFYYTFGSILALQVFFELGLTGIMTQFVAHEASHLTLNENAEYEGDYYYKSRLASLVKFCVKWYTVLAVVVFLFLTIVGFVFFSKYGEEHTGVNWETPWLLVCLATAIKLFQSPFNSILMGLGKVKEMSKVGFWQQVIQPSTVWIGLACGCKLYVAGIGYLLSVVIWFLFVQKDGLLKVLLNLWKEKVTERVSYLKEIFPFQWKIALSWVSGYFIFHLFNPVLFATDGAVVAGQMGMTLSALNAINSLSLSWLNTKVPLYSSLIARKEYGTLDTIFRKTLYQMIPICLFLLTVFFLVIWVLRVTQFTFAGVVLADRFLGYIPMLLLMIPIVIDQFVSSWATYCRCHKQEPFLLNSVVGGILCLSSTFFLGSAFGLYGITIGYCALTICMMPWGYHIYKTCKKKWHGE